MHRWKLSALAAAAFVSAALTPTDASALALGRIAVQSALGEPLRAEIDVPQATAAELDALQASIASPDVFKAHGMEYSSSARLVQVEVVRQADGTAKLKLSSRSPVTDPFVDLVVDANWAAGHLVRSYTLLLDPPATPQAAPTPAPTTAPQITASRPAAAPAARAGKTASSDSAAPAAAPAAAERATAKAEAGGDSVTVRSGDTAGRLANANRPSGVSLDQMLVAMLRANPSAFVNGNVNRLRAGSVVQLPNKEQASATTAKEARQIVAAQSRDFNEFRRRLAGKAPEAKVAAAERSSSGQVQAQVQDNSTAAAAADKLTLSKGAISQHAAEEKLAKDKQASAQADRVDELQRNLSELQKVASASAPASAAGTPAAATATAPAAATPGVTLPVEAPVVAAAAAPDASTVAPDAPTPAPAASDAPSAEASAATEQPAAEPMVAAPEAPKPEAVAKPVVVPPAPAPEPSFLEELTGDNPLILPAAGGVLALLLGLVGWRTVQRRRGQKAADATATDSQLPPDSFFGNSGGQQVDTRQSTMAASSTMAYSPSQLDAGGDVDPVAEAEVYLAYGRDVQAEEILKEALRTQPERLGVHMKLAEIYAKRQDAKAFTATALAVQPLTQGAGPSWDRIVELGQSVDASNPLFQGAPAPTAPSTSAFADALAKSHGMPAASVPKAAAAAAGAALSQHLPPDLDLSLDMDLPGGLSDAERADTAGPSSVLTPSDQDFAALEPNWNTPAQPTSTAAPAPAAAVPAAPQPLDLSTLEFSLDEPVAPAPAPAVAPATDLGLNLGDLNLDLGDTSASDAAAPAVTDDPLSTKLDLAREFHAIGDSEGARTLVEEVIAEASGDLKERAQRLLSEID